MNLDAARVEVHARRLGLLKALWNYRKRFGVGVTEIREAL